MPILTRCRFALGGAELSPEQALRRYQLQDFNRMYENPATHIMDIVQQYEQTYGRNEHAQVILKWRLNGHDEQTWYWPPE
jgi:hypothetical protein